MTEFCDSCNAVIRLIDFLTEIARPILMNQQQLLEVLGTVKTNVDTVGTNLTTIGANLTEAVDEIQRIIAELRDQTLSPEVAALVGELASSTETFLTETANIGTQAKTLADVVPNPEPTPEPTPALKR